MAALWRPEAAFLAGQFMTGKGTQNPEAILFSGSFEFDDLRTVGQHVTDRQVSRLLARYTRGKRNRDRTEAIGGERASAVVGLVEFRRIGTDN